MVGDNDLWVDPKPQKPLEPIDHDMSTPVERARDLLSSSKAMPVAVASPTSPFSEPSMPWKDRLISTTAAHVFTNSFTSGTKTGYFVEDLRAKDAALRVYDMLVTQVVLKRLRISRDSVVHHNREFEPTTTEEDDGDEFVEEKVFESLGLMLSVEVLRDVVYQQLVMADVRRVDMICQLFAQAKLYVLSQSTHTQPHSDEMEVLVPTTVRGGRGDGKSPSDVPSDLIRRLLHDLSGKVKILKGSASDVMISGAPPPQQGGDGGGSTVDVDTHDKEAEEFATEHIPSSDEVHPSPLSSVDDSNATEPMVVMPLSHLQQCIQQHSLRFSQWSNMGAAFHIHALHEALQVAQRGWKNAEKVSSHQQVTPNNNNMNNHNHNINRSHPTTTT